MRLTLNAIMRFHPEQIVHAIVIFIHSVDAYFIHTELVRERFIRGYTILCLLYPSVLLQPRWF